MISAHPDHCPATNDIGDCNCGAWDRFGNAPLPSGLNYYSLRAIADLTEYSEPSPETNPRSDQAPAPAPITKLIATPPQTQFLTESGIAERLAWEYLGKLIHVHELGWYRWDDKRWARDPGDAAVLQVVDRAIKEMVCKASAELDAMGPIKDAVCMSKSKVREAALRQYLPSQVAQAEHLQDQIKTGTNLQTRAHLNAIVDLMGTFPTVKRSYTDLDADPWLFNLTNGTLNLESGELQPHNPTDYITKISPIEYDPNATCPTFDRFLAEVQPDPDVRDFLQTAHGYSLTGFTREQCIFISQGTGANGKSVLDSVRRTVWGDYAVTADASTFMARNSDGIRNDVARLAGSRLVVAPETEQGRHIAETLIKQMTGGDVITSRFLYKESFEQAPTFKIWLSTNHRPQIKGTDNGIWRRIRLVPFPVAIEEARQDPLLDEKLKAEASGILAWAVRGCQKWRSLARLETPKPVKEAIDQYRQALDPLADWIDSECKLDPNVKTSTQKLYESYSRFCRTSGIEPIERHEFTDHLPHKGCTAERITETLSMEGGKVKKVQARGWRGIKLAS